MAAVIKEKTDINAELIEGSGGVFDVVVDGKNIFCKHDVDRFPTDEEILSQLT